MKKIKIVYAVIMAILSIALLYFAPFERAHTWDGLTAIIYFGLPVLGIAASAHTFYYLKGQ